MILSGTSRDGPSECHTVIPFQVTVSHTACRATVTVIRDMVTATPIITAIIRVILPGIILPITAATTLTGEGTTTDTTMGFIPIIIITMVTTIIVRFITVPAGQ